METTEECKFKLSKHLSKRDPTFIANFTNGYVNLKNIQGLEYKSYKSGSEISDHLGTKRILHVSNGRLDYSGFSDVSNGPHRYFIGVRNKSTGKMKMYDTAYFHIKPILKSSVTQTNEPKDYRKNIEDLISNFGSKTSKRSLNARTKHTVDSQSIENVIEDLAIETVSTSSSSTVSNNVDYLPPRNSEAVAAQDVYDINAIISEEELEILTDDALFLLHATADEMQQFKKENKYCKYVLSHLGNTLDIKKAQYLVYYDMLLSFRKLVYNDLRKRDPAPHIPNPFKQKILDNFTVVSSSAGSKSCRSFPPKLKDKLLSYMIVLALFIDDFLVNTELIQSDLKITTQNILTISQLLGCHIKTQGSVKFAELKMPLNNYKPRPFKKSKY